MSGMSVRSPAGHARPGADHGVNARATSKAIHLLIGWLPRRPTHQEEGRDEKPEGAGGHRVPVSAGSGTGGRGGVVRGLRGAGEFPNSVLLNPLKRLGEKLLLVRPSGESRDEN